ncbi:hypothetical protein GHT06_016104 [Daphnia sinensis]|uniref:Uncharacterized protein n=1 Tax=Daphnia sinensis TaxID=1820382 RepID=A0AAD5LAY4_9CRUS|nr:hypothetical protein GHT06_016104 [Daphnia sinensis]
MKFTFIFLMSLILVISHQHQHIQQLQRGSMWWPSIRNHEYPTAFHYYPFDTGMPLYRYITPMVYPQDEQEIYDIQPMMGKPLPDGFEIPQYVSSGKNVRPRIKSSMALGMLSNNPHQRLYYNTDSSNNPWLKTITLRITSTCTSLRLITCIPIANLPAAPVPACRRRRHLEFTQQQEDSGQYPILPTEVLTVTPTAQPWPTVLPSDYQDQTPSTMTAIDMLSSSKDEDQKNVVVTQPEKQMMRSGKFLGWQNFFTSTTTTSWMVVSSTLTQTFVPGVNLLCLPPGFVVC